METSPKFLGLVVENPDNLEDFVFVENEEENPSKQIQSGLAKCKEKGLIPKHKSGNLTNLIQKLEVGSETRFVKNLDTADRISIKKDEIDSHIEREELSTRYTVHRDPCNLFTSSPRLVTIMDELNKAWIEQGNIIIFGSQRPANTVMTKDSWNLNLRRNADGTFDLFVPRENQRPDTMNDKKRTAIGQILERKLLVGESDNGDRKIYGIFSIDIGEKVRFLFHSEIDHGQNCGLHALELKTKTFGIFPERCTRRGINGFLKNGSYKYKMKDMYSKCLLSLLNYTILAIVELDGNEGNFVCKTLRFQTRDNIPDFVIELDANRIPFCKDTVFWKLLNLGHVLSAEDNQEKLKTEGNGEQLFSIEKTDGFIIVK